MRIKTIIPLSTLFFVLVSTACKKETSSDQQPMPDITSLRTQTIIQQVKNDMEAELTASEYDNLDWNNLTVREQKTKETVVVVKSFSRSTDSLVYLISANIKVFQWGGRVQPVFKK